MVFKPCEPATVPRFLPAQPAVEWPRALHREEGLSLPHAAALPVGLGALQVLHGLPCPSHGGSGGSGSAKWWLAGRGVFCPAVLQGLPKITRGWTPYAAVLPPFMLGCYAGRVSVRTDFDCITDHPPTSAGGVFRFLARHF